MMRTFLLLALAPTGFFWVWHLLATNDIWFSREHHDMVFVLYAQLLRIEPGDVPFVFGKAVLLDGLIILAVVGYRRRRRIVAFVRGRLGYPAVDA